MPYFKRKSSIVEAIEIRLPSDLEAGRKWVSERGGACWIMASKDDLSLMILETAGDNTIIRPGCFIFLDNNEFYVMRLEKFHKLYEPLD